MLVALLFVGCESIPEVPAAGTVVDASAVEGIRVQSAIGSVGSTGAVVRAVNAYGAAVSSGPVSLTVQGLPVEVPLDGAGYGFVSASSAGSWTIGGAEEDASLHAVEGDWGGPGLLGAEPSHGEVVAAAAATGGWVVASAEQVWWVSPTLPAHPVLDLGDAGVISGLT